jgi:hypothetical protein
VNEPERASGDALDFVDDLLAEEEQERIAKLSPEELRAELARRGVDPKRVNDLVERVLAVAPGGGGVTSQAPDAAAKVVSMDRARARRAAPVVWVAVAAAAAVAIGVGTYERQAIEAWFAPPRTPEPVPEAPWRRPVPQPTPEQVAATTLRQEAFTDCAKGYWGLCERKLNEAGRLDPDGESDARVQAARAEIAVNASDARPFEGAKPPLRRR